MLYTTFSKPFADSKYRPSRTPETDGFLGEPNNTVIKNACIALNRMVKHQHGRKALAKEWREPRKEASSPHPMRSMHSVEAEENRGACRPNLTIYEQRHNAKRHTYNYHWHEDTERNEESENQVWHSRDIHIRTKKSCFPHPPHTQEAVKHSVLDRRIPKEHKQAANVEDFDENESEFLQPKINAHSRKFSIHNRLMPLDFNEGIMQKPSLVDLIKKFKFQNLKTSSIGCSSHSIEDQKYAECVLTKTQSKHKTHPFFKDEPSTTTNTHFQRRINRKASRERQVRQPRKTNLGNLKKSNSILSPWGTVTDHFFNQPILD